MDVRLTNDEVYRSWKNWYNFWVAKRGTDFKGHVDAHGGWWAYRDFLGDNPFDEFQQYIVSEDTAHKIRLLAGPHWHTMLEIYCVQKGIRK